VIGVTGAGDDLELGGSPWALEEGSRISSYENNGVSAMFFGLDAEEFRDGSGESTWSYPKHLNFPCLQRWQMGLVSSHFFRLRIRIKKIVVIIVR
jgi:hypothetical protein